ncbi:unnamed protein product [Adineta steineri]|uniref:Aminopeptidase n=1 Tax=Adineta steineri TaxID=433720 RepID=A0A814VRT1_9BILA|nr:unnamed protein product [Adineta steineri]
MASKNNTSPSIMIGETRTSSSSGNKRFGSLRNLPKSWLIAAIIFYCASVITVGLLAGLLPRRTQHITILATPTQSVTTTTPSIITPATTTTTTLTSTHEPSICIEDECNPRLSNDLIVHNYTLQYLYNDTTQTHVQGVVIIEFTLKQPMKQIIYHSKRMIELEEPALYENGIYQFVSMKKYIPHDYISLRLMANASFPSNRYKLEQKFVVSLTDGNTGFYQSIFQDGDETMGKLLSTKFEPTDARKAFPCFDEPHLKAEFIINIIHPENTIAIANFPIDAEALVDGLRQTSFERTFRMSTYLAAWAILPDTYKGLSDNDDEPQLTIWARREPTVKNHTALALKIATGAIPFFTEYFDTAVPMPPKTDFLAVPDFSSGAMENWGLITFREDRLIFDEKVVSTTQKHLFAETIVHELAHFWFGNYVTCKWWDDLWLNEAMATWLSYKPFAVTDPDWKMELQSLTENVIPSMWDDAKPSSHPIVVKNVTDAGEITSLFDSITYSKGASILRMLEKIVGSQTFRNGLREYLKINAFDVGDPSFFYNKLFNDTNGEEFMKNWLEELNYPLVNIVLKVENNETKVDFTQSRFIISNALDSSHLNQTYRWKIKLECLLGGHPDSDIVDVDASTIAFIFDTEHTTRIFPGKSYSWIKCNRDFTGYYVTEYSSSSSSDIWQHLSTALEGQPVFFSNEDRVNLLQDTFLLSYNGLVDYKEPLRIVRTLIKMNIEEYVHWRTFQWHWDTLANLVDYLPNILDKFQTFAHQQILSGGETLDTILTLNPTDNDNTKLIKGLKFEFLCRMNHADSIRKASELFKTIPIQYFNNSDIGIGIGADFLTTVYTYHLKHDDNEADWNMMFNYYKIAVSPQEQTRALMAICSTNNADRLNRLLNEGLVTGANTIRRQDYFAMMGYMSRHAIGRETVWSFYRDNYQRLVDTFTLEHRGFGRAILSITHSFQESSYLEQMSALFTRYPNAGAGTSARKQAVDQVNMNIEWIKSREQNLHDALDATLRQ